MVTLKPQPISIQIIQQYIFEAAIQTEDKKAQEMLFWLNKEIDRRGVKL